MKPLTSIARRDSGIALIIVMICIAVLGGLAMIFAFSMKVETRLAMNYNAEDEMLAFATETIGKALDYYATPKSPNEPWDALNQTWAGGPGSSMNTNGGPPFPENTRTIDLESRANINMADQMMLDRAMRVMNVDPADSGPIISSILDWIDPDKNEHPNGAETDYYESLTPSYKCKDGPVDDMSELGLVRGITENIHILWGVERNDDPTGNQSKLGFQQSDQAFARTPGLADLFSPLSSGQVNILTAKHEVIAMILGDEAAADRVIAIRAGQDGADGTDDDVPMREARDILANAQIPTQLINQVGRYFTTRSRLFQVEVHAKANNTERFYYALIDRDAKKVLTFFWKEKRLDSFNRIAKNADAR